MKALQGKPAPSASKSAKSKGRANGSDFSSARGSEERGSMAAQGGGRAPRRLRDYDLEQVCEFISFALFSDTTPLCGESSFFWAPPVDQYTFGSGFHHIIKRREVRLYPSTHFRQLRGTRSKGGLCLPHKPPPILQLPKFQQNKIGASTQQSQANLHHVRSQAGQASKDGHTI